jgi:hypothetical protein
MDDVGVLRDRNRIVDRINALFISTDNREWDAVRQCFAAAVLFDMTSMTGGEPSRMTPDQITDAWEQGLAALEAIHHQAGNHRVTVSGDEADAFCYATATHYLTNPTGRNTRTFVGSYDFHLVREGDEWRIDLFRFNLKYIDGNRDLEGSR